MHYESMTLNISEEDVLIAQHHHQVNTLKVPLSSSSSPFLPPLLSFLHLFFLEGPFLLFFPLLLLSFPSPSPLSFSSYPSSTPFSFSFLLLSYPPLLPFHRSPSEGFPFPFSFSPLLIILFLPSSHNPLLLLFPLPLLFSASFHSFLLSLFLPSSLGPSCLISSHLISSPLLPSPPLLLVSFFSSAPYPTPLLISSLYFLLLFVLLLPFLSFYLLRN